MALDVTSQNVEDLEDGVTYETTLRGVRGVFSQVTADQARAAFRSSSRADRLVFVPVTP